MYAGYLQAAPDYISKHALCVLCCAVQIQKLVSECKPWANLRNASSDKPVSECCACTEALLPIEHGTMKQMYCELNICSLPAVIFEAKASQGVMFPLPRPSLLPRAVVHRLTQTRCSEDLLYTAGTRS